MISLDDVMVILPAYNEANIISSVLKELQKEGFKNLVVVDDCSQDLTKKKALEAGAIVLRHVVNRGAGAATATGIEYAKRKGANYVLIMDSDGQHSPKDAKKLLKEAKNYDVIIGARLINFETMPLPKKIVNFIGDCITFLFFGLYVRDSQSGFKVLNRHAMEKIRITFDRYEFCSEIIGEMYRNTLSYKEVPIEVIYNDHSKAKKTKQSVSNGFKMVLRFIMKS